MAAQLLAQSQVAWLPEHAHAAREKEAGACRCMGACDRRRVQSDMASSTSGHTLGSNREVDRGHCRDPGAIHGRLSAGAGQACASLSQRMQIHVSERRVTSLLDDHAS